jgi:site-specific recombinase XerD
MREEWKEDPLDGYRENAIHLFGYPESTLAEYVRDLEHFQNWLGASAMGGDDSGGRNAALLLLGCGRGWIEDYLVELSNRGLRAVTINRKIYSLKGYASYCISFVIADTWSTGCSIADPQLSAGFKNILSLTRMLSIKP